MTSRVAVIDDRSMALQVYDVLRESVLDGRLEPGDRPSEVELAAELRVSRTPLREALRRLEADGLVKREKGRIVIPSLSESELLDLYEIRARLEGLAARQAAMRASDDAIAQLITADAASRQKDRRTVNAALAVGEDFHFQIARLSANQKNVDLIANVHAHIARYRAFTVTGGKPGKPTGWRLLDDHDAVLSALLAHDPGAAETAMIEHVGHARELLIDMLGRRLKTPAENVNH